MRMRQSAILSIAALIFLGALAAFAGPSAAQQSVGRIIASVNDAAITDYDLDARMKLLAPNALTTMSLPEQKQLARRALNDLIDDRLKAQEAERLSLKVSDAEIQAGLATIERNNDMQPGGLFAQMTASGIPVSAIIDMTKANLLWRKVVLRRVIPQISVAADEVNSALSLIRDAGGSAIVRAAEIFLPASEGDPQALAAEIAAQLADGGSFAQLAQRHSRSTTAAVGGDLGQIRADQLDPALQAALAQLQPGEVSPPVTTNRGVYLLRLIERTEVSTGDAAQAVVTLARATLRVANADAIPAARQQLADALQGIDGCDDFERAARTLQSDQPARVVDARIGDLPDELRGPVGALRPGEQTETFLLQDRVAVLMVCRRAEVGDGLPSAERVAESIQRQRAERRAERYLRDLRRVAFIDIRG